MATEKPDIMDASGTTRGWRILGTTIRDLKLHARKNQRNGGYKVDITHEQFIHRPCNLRVVLGRRKSSRTDATKYRNPWKQTKGATDTVHSC